MKGDDDGEEGEDADEVPRAAPIINADEPPPLDNEEILDEEVPEKEEDVTEEARAAFDALWCRLVAPISMPVTHREVLPNVLIFITRYRFAYSSHS